MHPAQPKLSDKIRCKSSDCWSCRPALQARVARVRTASKLPGGDIFLDLLSRNTCKSAPASRCASNHNCKCCRPPRHSIVTYSFARRRGRQGSALTLCWPAAATLAADIDRDSWLSIGKQRIGGPHASVVRAVGGDGGRSRLVPAVRARRRAQGGRNAGPGRAHPSPTAAGRWASSWDWCWHGSPASTGPTCRRAWSHG